jgi:hypothetical protein
VEARAKAYRMVAELLVGYRRIIHRGLVKLYGEDWLEGGCTDEIRDRLAARQAEELEVERTTSEGADLIHYTVFGDLVDLLKSDDALAGLLDRLAPSPEGLTPNLRALEDMRRQVAGGRFLGDNELVVLSESHLRLREKLAGARRKVQKGTPPVDPVHDGPPEQPAPEPVRADEPIDASAAVQPEADQPAAPPGPDAAVNQARRDATDELFEPEPETFRGSDLVDPDFLDGAATPVGLVDVEQNDDEILADLRREIIAAAEAAYGNVDTISTEVWQGAWHSGWYGEKVESYGLVEVAKFYAIMEQYLEGYQRGDDPEALKKFLADREFAKLLLRLRDLFDRLRV